ncbi:MAG: hypothetical protein ACJ795_17085 [Ktedonobacteraceae bacterium]
MVEEEENRGDGREDEWGDGRGKLDHYYLRGGVCWAGGEEV